VFENSQESTSGFLKGPSHEMIIAWRCNKRIGLIENMEHCMDSRIKKIIIILEFFMGL
jgi:hypothetical protein